MRKSKEKGEECEMRKKNVLFCKDNGITLITLVITIIILLILARNINIKFNRKWII